MRKLDAKKLLAVSLPVVLAALFFFVGAPAQASFSDWAGELVGGIIGIFIGALGLVLILVIKGLVMVVSYQNFIGSQAVVLGWVIVRDICNMFFVVILMIIAFGTILHLENYNYKKWLPKLILMAVLINFSKTICGLLIDVAQVVMLTFVNSFKDIAGANLTNVLGISDIVTMAKADVDAGFWTIVGAYVLGLIYLIVAIVVIVTMMMILVMRLVMIWIYVVLSPAAYLLAAFPGGQKYSSQWWSEFIKNLVVGPVLAFFIWLSLASLSADKLIADQAAIDAANEQARSDASKIAQSSAGQAGDETGFGSKASTPSALIKFVIAIGMLVGGLMVSQQIGGAAGSLAGKGMAALEKGKTMAFSGLKTAANVPLSYGVDKLHQKTGVDLNLKRVYKGWQEKREEIKEKRYAEGQEAAGRAMASGGRLHGVLAMTGNPGDAWEQITSWKGFKKRVKGGKAMARDRESAEQEKETIEKDLKKHEFENSFLDLDKNARQESLDQMTLDRLDVDDEYTSADKRKKDLESQISKENLKGKYKDEDKIKTLQAQQVQANAAVEAVADKKKELNDKMTFASANLDTKHGVKEQAESRQKVAEDRKALKKAEDKIESNESDYNFEARAAEQKAVSSEASKIKDITDPSELLRILKDAIQTHDKTMVKAIVLKMTKDYNDNEYLQPLVGRTDHKGLKDLMNQLSTKGSDNYAGFSQQEAYGLGSQVAEINKTTNHAAATAAYKMENGSWRETSDREHHQIRDIETGKQQLQAFLRNNNRLAYGYHDKKGDYHLDEGGIIKLMAIDTAAGHKNMETMNESAAGYIFEALEHNRDHGDKKLWDRFSKKCDEEEAGKQTSLIDNLKKRLGTVAGGRDIDDKLKKVADLGYTA
jgi:ABC-type multidrug transport system fused ATPase/permease subunit